MRRMSEIKIKGGEVQCREGSLLKILHLEVIKGNASRSDINDGKSKFPTKASLSNKNNELHGLTTLFQNRKKKVHFSI